MFRAVGAVAHNLQDIASCKSIVPVVLGYGAKVCDVV